MSSNADNTAVERILDAVAVPLLVCRDDHIVFTNHTFVQLCGFSPDQVRNMSLKTLLSGIPSDNVPYQVLPDDVQLLTASGKRLNIQFRRSSIEFAGLPCEMLTLKDVTHVRQLEERYRVIADAMIDVMVVTDGAGTILSVNPAVKDMLDYTPLELLNTKSDDLIHPADLAKFSEQMRAMVKGEKPVRVEIRLRRKNGDYIWVEGLGGVVRERNSDGETYISMVRDINQRKQVEEQLRLITDNMDDVVSQIDTDGIVIYVSPSCQTILGYSPEELMGQPGFELIHPDDLATNVEKFQLAILSHTTEVAEVRYLHKDGHYVWMESSAGAVYDNNGDINCLVACSRDISSRKMAEERLRRSEEQLRLLTDSMGDVMAQVGSDGTITYISPSCYTNFGFRPYELIGKPSLELVHPEDLPSASAKFQAIAVGNNSEVAEYRFLHKDGHYIWVESCGNRILDKDGQIAAFVTATRNITSRKLAEAQLRESEEHFRLLANNSTDMIAQLGDDGVMQYITPSCQAVLGYQPDELIGRIAFDFIHPDDKYGVVDKFQGVMTGLEPYFIEFRAKHKEGHYVWLELNTSVVHKSPGVIDHLVLAMRDISSRKKTEKALRASEEQYRLLADNSTDVIALHELDGRCIYTSPSVTQQTGWLPEEIEGASPTRLIHPQDAERVFIAVAQAIQDGKDVSVEYRFQCKDGGYTWVESHHRLIFQSDGTPYRLVVSTRNVTTRKQAELALQENEERLRIITDNMSDVVVQISPRGVIDYVSPSSRDMLGYDPHELIGEPTFVRIHQDDQLLVAQKFQEAYKERKPKTMEVRYRHKSGQYRWIEISGMVIIDARDSVNGLVASMRDVQARKHTNDALRESEERLRLIADNIHDLVTLTDAKLTVQYISPSYVQILEYLPEDLIGRSLFELVHPDDLEKVRQKVSGALERRVSESVECRVKHKSGYYVWVEAAGTIISNEHNEVTGAVITARDISERRWMQRAQTEQDRLVGALAKQQELNELKNRMMSRLSHELRTPLAVISTSADLLQHYAQRMTEEKRQERLQQIRQQIKHFTLMLDNMSLVVKGSNYTGEFAPSPYDLKQLSDTVIEAVKDALHSTQTVKVTLIGSYEMVNSDEKLMRLVMTHLLSNALKFSPGDSTVELNVEVSDHTITCVVSDNGIGIPPEDRPHIFEPFYRASNINEVPGLGIGLSIVNDAVNSVRGTIDIKSELNHGTRIRVFIPLNQDLERF
ncbi:MAG: PAS domain S-box protein [Anaerolineae bacterium]